MNGVTRINNTFAGVEVDRRAFAPVLSLYGARLSGCPLDKYYSDASAFELGQMAVLETFRTDNLFAPLNFPALGRCFGSELRFFEDQPPNICTPVLSGYKNWGKIRIPPVKDDPYLRFFVETVRRLSARVHGEVAICVPLPSIVDLPILILGFEGWMETLVSDRQVAAQIMRELEPWLRELAGLLLRAGASALAMTGAFASPSIVPTDIVLHLMRPALEQSLENLGGAVLFIHGGATQISRLSELASLPSVEAFGLEETDSFVEARRALGDSPVLSWGPNGSRLPSLNADAIRKHCLHKLESVKDDRRIMLSNSGVDIPWNTPPENIHALREAVELEASLVHAQ